jgi:hypothetical protein
LVALLRLLAAAQQERYTKSWIARLIRWLKAWQGKPSDEGVKQPGLFLVLGFLFDREQYLFLNRSCLWKLPVDQ